MEIASDSWPRLTDELPGVGGTVRKHPEDFRVDEKPLYLPCGAGDHLFIRIEKRGISTMDAIERLARALGRRPGEFGMAGLKDAAAVTRQYLSVENVLASRVESLELEGLKVLEAVPHGNKLKMGHLKGNQFHVRIRGVEPGALAHAEKILNRLSQIGVPNYFGPQRFGNLKNTHLLGLALVRNDLKGFVDILVATDRESIWPGYGRVIEAYRHGDFEEAANLLGNRYKYEGRALRLLVRYPGRWDKVVAGLDNRMLRFYYSAFQSFLFNQYLARRIGSLDRLEEGEIAFIHGKGASFLVENPQAEAERAARFEISPSGPLFGHKMLRPRGIFRAIEDEILKEADLDIESIRGSHGIRLRGARRPLRVPIESCRIMEADNDLELSFFLPQGAYATVVLREVMKTQVHIDE